MASPPAEDLPRQPDPFILLVAAGFLACGAFIAMTWGSEALWEGHSLAGLFAFLLLILTILSGASMKRRITLLSPEQAARLHRIAGIAFVIIVVGTFLVGLETKIGMGEPVMQSPHGWIGLALVVLSLVQLVPKHLLPPFSGARALHRGAGYLILPVFLLQIAAGVASVPS